jgi:hypothetical protein
MSNTGTKTTYGEMTEYVYDGATIEEIITSHDTHDYYNSLRVWYRGEELNLKELEIVVYQEEVD